ncbi:MAG: prepilin-type N-terminal cleavage/methylation domain-containing protein [Lachnospiraceae bacterium]|nr:prepilin-type N-terminal cleavage/methylation domain-containing protein [Lachnospiraceae bacterium]
MGSKNKSIRKMNNAGLTLVEMIVTFALLGLFMVAACRVIAYTVNIYFAAKGIDNSLVVADLIADKTEGLVGSMCDSDTLDYDTINNADTGVTANDTLPYINDDKLYFVNDTNCPVCVWEEDGELRVTYYNKITSTDVGGNELVEYKQVPWSFDKKAYMGYSIKEGTFKLEKAGSDYPDNVYKLEFTITSPKFGDYPTTRYIKCFNKSEEDS